MKKNYTTPCANLSVIEAKDIITLSVMGSLNLLALDEEAASKRDMEWTWTSK